jgi:hypothetical protein
MITATQLPIELVQAAELATFTTANTGSLAFGNAFYSQSSVIAIPAGKALLVSFDSVNAAHFVVEYSVDGGTTWVGQDSFTQPDTSRRSVYCYTGTNQAWKVRFGVAAACDNLTSFRVAYQVRG